MMSQFTIDQIVIKVTRKNIKNIRLTVQPPDGQVKISSPIQLDDQTVLQFAQAKLDWIKKHQTRFQDRVYPPAPEFKQGERINFQGQLYYLNIIDYELKPKIAIRDDYLDLYISPRSGQADRSKIIDRFYRGYLTKTIPLYIQQWEPVLNVVVQKWRVRSMKTRWGSCNTRTRSICLNLELAKKEPRCLEYVIVHEMAHILEPNHGSWFIALMNLHIPEWRFLKVLLNKS
jgi:predicted metal-dependent hydrolase